MQGLNTVIYSCIRKTIHFCNASVTNIALSKLRNNTICSYSGEYLVKYSLLHLVMVNAPAYIAVFINTLNDCPIRTGAISIVKIEICYAIFIGYYIRTPVDRASVINDINSFGRIFIFRRIKYSGSCVSDR